MASPQPRVLAFKVGQAVGQAHEAVLVALVLGLQQGVALLQLAEACPRFGQLLLQGFHLRAPGAYPLLRLLLVAGRYLGEAHPAGAVRRVGLVENVFHNLARFLFCGNFNLPIGLLRFQRFFQFVVVKEKKHKHTYFTKTSVGFGIANIVQIFQSEKKMGKKL